MADPKYRWKVLRRHDGDHVYEEGEIRVGTQAELGHLAPKTLELVGPADPEPEGKAEPASPKNKASTPPANKGRKSPSKPPKKK